MKKKVITLATLGVLAGSPNGHAQIDSTKVETQKDLVEAVSKQDVSSDNLKSTISFEDAKKMQEKQDIKESMMNNEEIQELIKKYGKEKIEKMVDDVLKGDNLENFTKDFLTDEAMQKSLEEGNDVDITEKIEKFFSFKMGEGTILDVITAVVMIAMFGFLYFRFLVGIFFVEDLHKGHLLFKYIIKIKNGRIHVSKRELTDEQKKEFNREWGPFWVSKYSGRRWGEKKAPRATDSEWYASQADYWDTQGM